jgi:hypothetical protein
MRLSINIAAASCGRLVVQAMSNLNRRLDWIALRMLYILCPVLLAGLAVLAAVEMFHG